MADVHDVSSPSSNACNVAGVRASIALPCVTSKSIRCLSVRSVGNDAEVAGIVLLRLRDIPSLEAPSCISNFA